MPDPPKDYESDPNRRELTDAEWLADLHAEDDELKEIAAALKSAYAQIGSPHPMEEGHWLALAAAIAN